MNDRRPSALLAAALALTLSGCAFLQRIAQGGFQPPKLSFQSWSADQLDLEGVTIALHYQLENPNQLGLDLRRITYKLEVEGTQAGEGELSAGIQVPPRGAAAVSIPVRLRWRDVPRLAEVLLSRAEVAYRITGSAGVGSALGTIELPFDHRDRVAIPRPPSFRIEGITVRNASLADVAIDVRLRIENGNGFPLPVGALTYGLRVGQRDLLAGGSHPLAAVPPGGHAVISIPIRLSTVGAAQGIADLLSGAAVRLQGLADFGAIEVPVEANGALKK